MRTHCAFAQCANHTPQYSPFEAYCRVVSALVYNQSGKQGETDKMANTTTVNNQKELSRVMWRATL